MKPLVGAGQAWFCLVVSVFAVIILSILGSLFARNHHTVMGMEEDPEPGSHAAVASSIFIAVAVYAGFIIFCGAQAWLHVRASRRGAISLR